MRQGTRENTKPNGKKRDDDLYFAEKERSNSDHWNDTEGRIFKKMQILYNLCLVILHL